MDHNYCRSILFFCLFEGLASIAGPSAAEMPFDYCQRHTNLQNRISSLPCPPSPPNYIRCTQRESSRTRFGPTPKYRQLYRNACEMPRLRRSAMRL